MNDIEITGLCILFSIQGIILGYFLGELMAYRRIDKKLEKIIEKYKQLAGDIK